MSHIAMTPQTRDIVVDEILPHAPETVWKALTTGAMIARWMMEPAGFAPVVGNRFTFRTTPAGAWDGVIRCEVLEVEPVERFAYSWRGGDESNAGYGSPLDTVVTFVLARVDGGTRLRVVHSGFQLPKNDTAFSNLGKGWKVCVERILGVVGVVGGQAAGGQS